MVWSAGPTTTGSSSCPCLDDRVRDGSYDGPETITFAEFIPISRGALLNQSARMYPLFVLELVFLVDLVVLLPIPHRFAAVERSGRVRRARSIGIALRRPRGDLLARHRGRLADCALAGAAHQVD